MLHESLFWGTLLLTGENYAFCQGLGRSCWLRLGRARLLNAEAVQAKPFRAGGLRAALAERPRLAWRERFGRGLRFQMPTGGCRTKRSFFVRAIMTFQLAELHQRALINSEHSAIAGYRQAAIYLAAEQLGDREFNGLWKMP